jgi:hypothetical protein
LLTAAVVPTATGHHREQVIEVVRDAVVQQPQGGAADAPA